MKKLVIIITILITQTVLFAQEQPDIENMSKEEIMALSYDELLELSFEDLVTLSSKLGISIDDLLKMKTSVASKTALNPRETPGIISIVTDEEIKSFGARDLTDVLAMIPGIGFTYDAQGVIGIQMRGNWGFEGKVLFIVDGMELNELQYNVFPLLNHIQVDNIKRIEIIRGPGSAIYGGSAELGVINIVTKNGNDLKGIEANLSSGFTSLANSKNTANLSVGDKIDEFQYSLNGSFSKSRMSDGLLKDSMGVFNMADSLIPIESYNVNLALSYKGLKTNFLYDYYRTEYGDYATDPYIASIGSNEFSTFISNVSYDVAVNKKFHLVPQFNYKYSKPYYSNEYPYCININRIQPGLQGVYDFNDKINLIAGLDYYFDDYNMINSDSISYFGDNNSISNLSAYAQALMKTNFANFTIGARFENNSKFGNAIAPRLAVTKIFDRLHMKLLFSGSFRSPAIGNLVHTTCDSTYEYSGYEFEFVDVKPEQTWVFEFETGYKLNKYMFVTANFYDMTINNTITWFENDFDWGYTNYSKTGTRGFEVEYRAKYKKGFANASFAYYTAKNKNKVEYYAVADDVNTFLGSPQQKLSLAGGYNLVKNLSISMTMIYRSSQFADYEEELNGVYYPATVKYKPTTTVNAFLRYNNKYFDAGFGVNNILNQDSYWIQPYQSNAMPMPTMGREYFVKLGFNLPI